ncbi:hypothetical protein CSA56_03710 [candidate division KSB3 bacterium]|uniref:RDD family protein n=1 Tax=candidate division KSB3 bacterium TaxID=2044937 RepID=A0A2G6KIU3_9BACT|nr:MAG: hypothetical protein CSA56_03710 [candidate division KSB3 bacterium]
MNWYYADEGRRVGPFDEFEFKALVETGVIVQTTLVWNETLSKWTRYSDLNPPEPEPVEPYFDAPEPESDTESEPEHPTITFAQKSAKCRECGKPFNQDEMIRFQNTWVCANCKPIFVQKLKEGANLADDMQYAGFGIRFAAKLIDGLIQVMISWIIAGTAGAVLFFAFELESSLGILLNIIVQVLGLLIGVGYTTFFLGKYGATPGKMMFHLKVVTADGETVSYGRAFGRHFAEGLSALILSIGYIMVAFDKEKRALHDRICDTRVIITKR